MFPASSGLMVGTSPADTACFSTSATRKMDVINFVTESTFRFPKCKTIYEMQKQCMLCYIPVLYINRLCLTRAVIRQLLCLDQAMQPSELHIYLERDWSQKWRAMEAPSYVSLRVTSVSVPHAVFTWHANMIRPRRGTEWDWRSEVYIYTVYIYIWNANSCD